MTVQPGTAFQAAVEEFLRRTRELVGHESAEDIPPPPLAVSGASPVPAGLVLDEETVIRYALSIGDENQLFTNPAYARASRYGGLVAPGPILVHVRYPADHGAARANGYPLANFITGVAWEFFDVIRAGTRFSSSKVLREVFERRGQRGRRLIHLVCEVTYFDALGRPVAKAYGTLVQVPVPSMGTHRAMPPGRLREELFSDRDVHRYDAAEVDRLLTAMRAEQRQGADPLFWEDVEAGAALQPIVQPPYMLHDTITYQSLHQGLFAGYAGGPFSRAFTPGYWAHRTGWGYPDFARVHPKTWWPFTPGDEHEDAHLCAYRGQPLPFDFGVQRAQIPYRLVSNWAGDDAFVRKFSMTMRRPLFYGDALIVRGRVGNKTVVPDPQPCGPRRHAVRIAMEGANQRGEVVSRGYASVYLTSREHGRPELPLQYGEPPPYVSFRQHNSPSWY
jgi:acyl dehydratase